LFYHFNCGAFEGKPYFLSTRAQGNRLLDKKVGRTLHQIQGAGSPVFAHKEVFLTKVKIDEQHLQGKLELPWHSKFSS
jgi:hypothetical protein